MSRAGFSIRKLITQRRTWPDSDSDNEDAFECSSAKTIRVQYELEQYQQQQLQKELRHAHKSRSSWMSSNSSPKRKTYKRVPKPIVVVGHSSNGVMVHSGSASRRISTPLPASALSGVLTPGTAHSHSSDGSLSSSGDDCSQRHHRHQRHHSDSKAAPSAAVTASKPRLSTPTMTAGWISPRGGALCPVTTTPPRATKKSSHEGRSFLDLADTVSPSPESACGDQDRTSFPQPTPAPNSGHHPHVKTPTTIKTPLSPAATTADKKTIAMHSHQQRDPRYVHISESYTLKPPTMSDAKDRQVGDREVSRAVQDPSKVSDDDENTFERLLEGKDHHDCDHLPDNVQQLIWETDEAFKAVGTALAEARLASQSHPQSKELQEQVNQLQRASQALQIQTKSLDSTLMQTLPPTTYQAPVSRIRKDSLVTSPLSPTPGRGSITSFPRKNKSSPVSSSGNMLRSPTHASSIKKAKRKSPSRPRTPRSATTPTPTTSTWPDTPAPTSKASTFGPSASSAESSGGTAHRQQTSYRSLSRWNLKADNVTEKLFNGSRGRFGFHKIEADEVVTPGQVQQYRQSRIAKAQAEAQAETRRSNSNESLRSTAGSVGGAVSDGNSANTPVEPFHLQDLPSRIGSSGTNLGVLSPVAEVLTPKSFTFDLDKDPSRKSNSAEPKTPTTATWHPKQEQTPLATPLATPPPTPPQPSPNACAARFHTSVASPDEDTTTFFKSHSFPDPPVKEASQRPTHKRGNSSSSRVPILPTIPEVRVTSPPSQDDHLKPQNGRRPSEMHMDQPSPRLNPMDTPNFEEDDEYLFFKSAPFTLNVPSFEHGRIRLAKADLVNAGTINSLESKLLSSPDETLDWTAFQMAILGGAGDFFSDPSDFCARDAEEEMVDDLCDWLEGFGLPTNAMGALVKTEEKAPTMSPIMPYTPAHVSAINPPGSGSRSFHDPSRNHSINHIVNGSTSSCSGSARSSGEVSEGVQEMLQVQSMPIPINSEHPSGFWNTRPFDAARFYTGGGIKRWTLEGHPKRYQGPGIDVDKANTLQRGSPKPSPDGVDGGRVKLREGVDSLPQSPMLDLVMTTGVDGSKEYVPMGYNLGHDLGDFLKWESENVYATAFYGSD